MSEKFSLLFRRKRGDDLLEARIAAEPVPKVASVPTYQSSGLARMERANPLVVQTLDVVGAFTALAAVSPFLHLFPWRQPYNLVGPNLLCTRSDVHVKAWAVGD